MLSFAPLQLAKLGQKFVIHTHEVKAGLRDIFYQESMAFLLITNYSKLTESAGSVALGHYFVWHTHLGQ